MYLLSLAYEFTYGEYEGVTIPKFLAGSTLSSSNELNPSYYEASLDQR